MIPTDPVLVVDDDAAFLKQLRKSFEEIQLPGEFFSDVESAIQALQKTPFSGAIVDLHFAVNTGISVLSEIYQSEQPIPVVIISHYRSLNGAIAALKLGARDFLLKPVSAQQLIRSLFDTDNENSLKESILDPEKLTEEINVGDPVSMETIENEHIRRVIKREGNVAKAAKVLQVNRTTLFRKRHVWESSVDEKK